MTLQVLLNSEPWPGWAMQIVECAFLLTGDHASSYMSALRFAIEDEPLPFSTRVYAELYRKASSDGQWLALSVLQNAESAGSAARRLWLLAATANTREERALL